MSSVLSMRQFVCEKLAIVAQEIQAAFEKTLEGHEAEICPSAQEAGDLVLLT